MRAIPCRILFCDSLSELHVDGRYDHHEPFARNRTLCYLSLPLPEKKMKVISLAFVLVAVGAFAQQAHWASPDDPTAKVMIDSERRWAESACDHNPIASTLLADDFQGTGTEGTRYTKKDEVADNADTSKSARDCQLGEAHVRFFGDNLAVIYGSESSVRKEKGGVEQKQCQVWTDTWLKRDARWQIVAAQDTKIPCK